MYGKMQTKDNTEYNKLVIELIKHRASVRTYNKEQISQELIQKLDLYCANVTGPFGSKVRFRIVSQDNSNQFFFFI